MLLIPVHNANTRGNQSPNHSRPDPQHVQNPATLSPLHDPNHELILEAQSLATHSLGRRRILVTGDREDSPKIGTPNMEPTILAACIKGPHPDLPKRDLESTIALHGCLGHNANHGKRCHCCASDIPVSAPGHARPLHQDLQLGACIAIL